MQKERKSSSTWRDGSRADCRIKVVAMISSWSRTLYRSFTWSLLYMCTSESGSNNERERTWMNILLQWVRTMPDRTGDVVRTDWSKLFVRVRSFDLNPIEQRRHLLCSSVDIRNQLSLSVWFKSILKSAIHAHGSKFVRSRSFARLI